MSVLRNPIYYSEKYTDDVYEYRHVTIPIAILKLAPKNRLLQEAEWRALGIQQSRGWEHYCIFKPEPHVLPFRRILATTTNDDVTSN